MKKTKQSSKKPIHIALGVTVLVAMAIGMHVLSLKHRLQTKVEAVQRGIEEWAEDGRDPSEAIRIMQKVPEAFKNDDVTEAEKSIDAAQEALNVPRDKRPRAKAAPGEESSDMFGDPRQVKIDGYTGQAMEPFISPDGKTLFFNNENDPGVNIDLYFAARTGPDSFKFMGELKGVNTKTLEAAASMDKEHHIFFTASRVYEETRQSIFRGTFDGHEVTDVHPASGDINPKIRGHINMDVGISPDGNTMYISRAVFKEGLPSPKESDLMVAHQKNFIFSMDPRSEEIMKNVNTKQLEYAPAISEDGRTLFFSRAQAPEEPLSGPQFRIMVATRDSDTAPFGKPKVLTALSGMVEAPSVPLDLGEIFFHKKVNGKWVIFRALRKGRH